MNSVRPSQRGLMYGPSLNPTLSEAERHYRKALRLCRWWAPVYRDEAAANLIGLGTLAQIRGRFRKTIRLASRAIREAGRAEDARHVIAGERRMGAAYKVLGRRGEAEAHIWHTGHRTEAESAWKQALRLAGKVSPARKELAAQSIRICKADRHAVER